VSEIGRRCRITILGLGAVLATTAVGVTVTPGSAFADSFHYVSDFYYAPPFTAPAGTTLSRDIYAGDTETYLYYTGSDAHHTFYLTVCRTGNGTSGDHAYGELDSVVNGVTKGVIWGDEYDWPWCTEWATNSESGGPTTFRLLTADNKGSTMESIRSVTFTK
jgi:hypothetical protein